MYPGSASAPCACLPCYTAYGCQRNPFSIGSHTPCVRKLMIVIHLEEKTRNGNLRTLRRHAPRRGSRSRSDRRCWRTSRTIPAISATYARLNIPVRIGPTPMFRKSVTYTTGRRRRRSLQINSVRCGPVRRNWPLPLRVRKFPFRFFSSNTEKAGDNANTPRSHQRAVAMNREPRTIEDHHRHSDRCLTLA